MIVVTLVSWLLIGCLVVSSQSTDQDDNRWVWRSLRSPSTSLELPLNPFEPFPSSSEEARQTNSKDNSSAQRAVIPRRHQDDVISQRGNPEGARLSSFSPKQTTTPVPNVDLNLASVGRTRSPSFIRDSRQVVQQNLGIAHFTIPRQLGRPVTVTTPTSNHLHAENEPLVSSYSSLDAEVTGLNELKKSKNRNRGRNLINPPVRKALGSIAIKPLPIDISKLPLESTERAEGIKKLWSSLTSRTEFAQIFEALAGRRRNNSSERRERNPNTEAESSAILLDPHNSISESVIRVINPPQIQLQQQILKQQLRQQELQRRLQEQFEAEIHQEELKKQLELQNLIREREEQQKIAIQHELPEEQQHAQEELLHRQQQVQPQTGEDSQRLTEDEHLSDELQDLSDPEDILRRRHERLVERLRRRKESQSHTEQRRTREEIQERQQLHQLQQQQRLQQLRQRLTGDVLSTTTSTVSGQSTSTEPSENDVSEEAPQRASIVFPPPLPLPSRSLSPPNPDTRGVVNPSIPNTTATVAQSGPGNTGTNTDGTNTDGTNPAGTNNAGVTSSATRDVRTVNPGTAFPGTITRDTSSGGGTNIAGTNTGGTNTSGADGTSNLLQTTVRFPQREGDFVVRKIRLPGNHIMNVVFVPDEKNSPGLHSPRPDISQSPSALRLFQSEDVQKSLLEVQNQNTVLVVEELIRDGKNLYLITTMQGERVYPKEPEEEAGAEDGNVWAAFVGVFSGESDTNTSAASSFSFRHDSPTSISSTDEGESTVDSFAPVIRDPRTPLAKVRFSAGNIQTLSGGSEVPQRSSDNIQAPHAFLVKFRGREHHNPFTPVANREFFTRQSVHQNKRLELPSSSVSTRFFNPFRSQAQNFVGRSLRVQASGGRDPHGSGIPNEARGLESSHSRWPWPDEVPANLDAFFHPGPSNFGSTRSLR